MGPHLKDGTSTNLTFKALLKNYRNKLIFLSKIHPADTFPLAVSIAIAVQGLIFIGAQGAGLGNPRISDCRSISQIVWPGSSYRQFLGNTTDY